MIRSKSCLASVLLIGTALVLPPSARAEEPKGANVQALEDQLKIVRGDIQQQRESALRTLVLLNESQAKAFWPLKDQYDGEIGKIGESRLTLLREYAKVHQKLTAATAKDFAARSLKLDEDRNNLRRKYFDLMSEKVSPIAASQFLQLQRQFETMMDLKVQAVVPLAGIM